MAGEGRKLKEAREEKNWSYTEAEDITKISVRYLRALEAEEYNILPGATYTKGYLRTYAKHLGLNPDEIAALYKASATSEPAPVYRKSRNTAKPSKVRYRPLLILGTAILAIILVITIASWNRSGSNSANTNDLPTLPKSQQNEAKEPSTNNGVPSPENTPDDPSNSAQGGELLPEEIPRLNDDNAADQQGLNARLTFAQDCWMLIRIDGGTSYQELFIGGTTRDIKADNKIEFLTIGNAPALTTTLNGKILPSFTDGRTVVNNIVLTQETLDN